MPAFKLLFWDIHLVSSGWPHSSALFNCKSWLRITLPEDLSISFNSQEFKSFTHSLNEFSLCVWIEPALASWRKLQHRILLKSHKKEKSSTFWHSPDKHALFDHMTHWSEMCNIENPLTIPAFRFLSYKKHFHKWEPKRLGLNWVFSPSMFHSNSPVFSLQPWKYVNHSVIVVSLII